MIVVITPWGRDPFQLTVAVVLHVVPIVSLALLTYVAGRIVQRDEQAADPPTEDGPPDTAARAQTHPPSEPTADEDH